MRAILTYHSIDDSGSPISCDRAAFDRHVAWLASGRVTVTTIDQLVAMPESADAVAITFDDAFTNFEELAAPRLLAHALPVTVFVVADRVGGTNAWSGVPERSVPHLPLLGWDALRRLREQGVQLGAHSRTHPELTGLAPAALEDEVAGSARIIARETGVQPVLFAYPYGRTDAGAVKIVERTFRYGCTTEFRGLDGILRPAQLPRLDMYYFREPGRLESWGARSLTRFITTRRRLRALRRLGAAATRTVHALRSS